MDIISIFKIVLELLNKVNYKYVGIGLAIVAVLGGTFYAGENRIQGKWDAANIKTEKQIADLTAKADKVTVQTVIQYVDRVKIVTIKGATVTEYVDRYITEKEDANCVIPKNVVLFLNSAATNTVPEQGVNK